MSLKVIWTTAFKKDYKRAMKRGSDIELIDTAIKLLASGKPLPPDYKDHNLSGNWKGFRECHILPDWLIIYKKESNILVLTLVRTGTHSDLFDK